MGAIQNHTIQDFSAEVKSQMNVVAQDQNTAQQVDAKIQEFFANRAQNDNGENPNEYEDDNAGFSSTVSQFAQSLSDFVKTTAQKFTEFIPGNSKTKQNGAIDPDTYNQYENGQITKSTKGFDEDDSKTIEGGERTSEFIAGNSKTKQNGAIDPDKMTIYENGKPVETIAGFDENGDGNITGDEIQYRQKLDE